MKTGYNLAQVEKVEQSFDTQMVKWRIEIVFKDFVQVLIYDNQKTCDEMFSALIKFKGSLIDDGKGNFTANT